MRAASRGMAVAPMAIGAALICKPGLVFEPKVREESPRGPPSALFRRRARSTS
jgi:hypothetical protein